MNTVKYLWPPKPINFRGQKLKIQTYHARLMETVLISIMSFTGGIFTWVRSCSPGRRVSPAGTMKVSRLRPVIVTMQWFRVRKITLALHAPGIHRSFGSQEIKTQRFENFNQLSFFDKMYSTGEVIFCLDSSILPPQPETHWEPTQKRVCTVSLSPVACQQI